MGVGGGPVQPTTWRDLARQLVVKHEGCVLSPYEDAAGHATIGYGHLLHKGPVTPADLGFDLAAAERLLSQDLERFWLAAGELQLRPEQRVALTSFAFNVGVAAARSSSVWRRAQAGQHLDVPAALLMWRKSGGKVLLGLLRRRLDEAEMYLGSHELLT